MALITTVGSSTANSYATTTEFAAYVATTQWADAFEGANVEALLLEAMTVLETQNFIGTKALLDQALQWPRVGGGARREVLISGLSQTYGLFDLRDRFYASNAIPTPIKNAQCALAMSIYFDFSRLELSTSSGVSFSAGSVRIGPEVETVSAKTKSMQARAMRELNGLVIEAGKVKRLVRC